MNAGLNRHKQANPHLFQRLLRVRSTVLALSAYHCVPPLKIPLHAVIVPLLPLRSCSRLCCSQNEQMPCWLTPVLN